MKKFILGIFYILKGMKRVAAHLFRPAITYQYPEQKMPKSNRFRGRVSLCCDENGKLKCEGCGLCIKVCPCFDVIKIKKEKDETGKNVLKEFQVDIGKCIFCGNCESVCPSGSIVLSKEYELANYDKDKLILNVDDLVLSVEKSKEIMESKKNA